MIRKLSAVAISTVTALSATSAFAQTTAPAPAAASASSSDSAADFGGGASAALFLSYGSNDLKFGIGGRGGYTLPQAMGPGHLYIGGELADHFPGSGVNVFYIGPEVGYELPAGPIMVRPYVGLGLAHESVSVPSVTVDGTTFGGGSESSTDFAFWFGATALYPVTSNIGVGADAKIMLVDNFNAFIFSITGQYHF